jgi:hypothetical protein
MLIGLPDFTNTPSGQQKVMFLVLCVLLFAAADVKRKVNIKPT